LLENPLQEFLIDIHYTYPLLLGSPIKLAGYPRPSISAASIPNEAWANTGLKIKFYLSEFFKIKQILYPMQKFRISRLPTGTKLIHMEIY